MFGWESFGYALWWIFPIVIIALCFFLCLFMVRGCMDRMMGRHDPHDTTDQRWWVSRWNWYCPSRRSASSDSAMEILNKQYSLGEIDKKEYDTKRKRL